MTTIAEVQRKIAKENQAPSIGKTTKNVLEIGVQSAVVSTVAPGAAAGVGQVYSAGIPLMALKGISSELGGAVKVTPQAVAKEKREHTWLTDAEARRIAMDHAISGGGAVPSQSTTTAKSNMRCPSGHCFKPGQKIFKRQGTEICPICGHSLKGHK